MNSLEKNERIVFIMFSDFDDEVSVDNAFITSICLCQVRFISSKTWQVQSYDSCQNEFAFYQPQKMKLKSNERGNNVNAFYIVRNFMVP